MNVEQARVTLTTTVPQRPVVSTQDEAGRTMTYEEANGREQLTAALAVIPETTVERTRPILAVLPQMNAGLSLRDQIMVLDEAKGVEVRVEQLAACPGITMESARAMLVAGSGKAEPVSASTTAVLEHFMTNHSLAMIRSGVVQTSTDGDAGMKVLMAVP